MEPLAGSGNGAMRACYTTILIITLYLPPPVNIESYKFIEIILNKIENSNINYNEIIFIGDFNTDYSLTTDNNYKHNANILNNIFNSFNLSQKVRDFTYPQNKDTNSHSVLDLLFSKNDLVYDINIIPSISINCDHYAITFKIKLSKNKVKTSFKEIIIISDKAIENINSDMNNTNWYNLTNSIDNIDDIYQIMINKAEFIINKHVSRKKVKQNKYPKFIRKLILKKRKVPKSDLNKIRFYHNELKTQIFIFNKYKLNSIIKTKDFNKLYKNIKHQNKDFISNIFSDNNNKQITNSLILSDNFGKQFNCDLNVNSNYNYYETNNINNLSHPIITLTDILREMQKINIKVNIFHNSK